MIRTLILTAVLVSSQAAFASVPSSGNYGGDPNMQSGKVMKEARQARGSVGCGASAEGTLNKRMRSESGEGESRMARTRMTRSAT